MTNKMKTLIIVLGLLSLFTVGQAKSIETVCSFQINGDLPNKQPLLLIESDSLDVRGFYLPADDNGIVTIATGQKVLFACPGNTNSFIDTNLGIRTALATCDSGTTFTVNSVDYDFSDFACSSYPSDTVQYTGSRCYGGTKPQIEVGFKVESLFYRLMDICFDDVRYNVLYVKSTIVSDIAGYQKSVRSNGFVADVFYTDVTVVDNLYSKVKQRETISDLLRSDELGDYYIEGTGQYYLARGHHSAKADYVYGSQQLATYHFANISPQWQSINNGNWKALEASVRGYAYRNKIDLEVYTGTYGVATLPDVNGFETELYLSVKNNVKQIPVSKLLWKAVYDPNSQRGVVFVTVNDPHYPLRGDYLICTDVCLSITWVNWKPRTISKGYSYCCEVDDFRSTVNYLPQFTVRGLLT